MHGVLDLPDRLRGTADVIAQGLLEVDRVFEQTLRTDLGPVMSLVTHVERYRGKMLRPVVSLTAGLAAAGGQGAGKDGGLSHRHHVVAAVCEMVHMATLVHDDVLDEAEVRRRGATINKLHGNEAAVMLGDYLIASAYALCSSLADPAPARRVARASQVVCAGELLQLHHREDLSLDEPTYFEIVSRKTGELIAAAAELGAWASGASAEVASALGRFGMGIGVAFQVQDDVLDLTGEETVVGKSVGRDLAKGKMTLPVIHHLVRADLLERGRTLDLIERAMGGDGASAARVRELLVGSGSIEQARGWAERHVTQALDAIAPLPESDAKDVLKAMANAVLARSY